MEPIIAAKNISQEFTLKDGSVFTALKDVNIEVYEHQLTILKGRSGSGKTTLLNLLGLLDRPAAGEVYFEGKNVTDLDERARALLRRKKIGFVFQSVALIPMMNAYENVEYALRLAGYKGSFKNRATDCLKMVGLTGRMSHMPQQLSGGEQQRVGIARAAAHKPAIIFADEPTGALDSNTGLQVMKMLKSMTRNDNVAIVMTTHDPGIMDLGDRGYELEDGEIIGKW